MKSEKEIDKFIEKIKELWKKYPYARFGQLLFNHTRFGTRTQHLGTVIDPFHFQDNDIIEDINEELKK